MMTNIFEYLKSKPYPGRGIILGTTPAGKEAAAYFIMGRSENSRNRVFLETQDGIRTEAHDPSKMTDPSLIIYHPVRTLGGSLIVTNGDQTDTIYNLCSDGQSYIDALGTREFEPDEPNYTPRISGISEPHAYMLSIIKTAGGNPDQCQRHFFTYATRISGQGHFISTYEGGGDPVPSFSGEPVCIEIADENPQAFAEKLWDSLDADNKVSLYVNIGGEVFIINKNQ